MRSRTVVPSRAADGDVRFQDRRAGDAPVLARHDGVGQGDRLLATPVARVRLRQIDLAEEQTAGHQRIAHRGQHAVEIAVGGELVGDGVDADRGIDPTIEAQRADVLAHQRRSRIQRRGGDLPPRLVEHRLRAIDARDLVARPRQRDHQVAGPDAEIDHAPDRLPVARQRGQHAGQDERIVRAAERLLPGVEVRSEAVVGLGHDAFPSSVSRGREPGASA